MGGPKQRWTAEEEEALRLGVEKYGTGKWKLIQRDLSFTHLLAARSNVDLKDKWRNLVAGGQVSLVAKVLPSVPISDPKTPASSTHIKQEEPPINLLESLPKGHQSNEHTAMIMEAISALQEPGGAEIGEVFSFIETRYQVSSNFRKQLSAKLRRLATQDKIEKVGRQRYKLKVSSFATSTPMPTQEDDPAQRMRPVRHLPSPVPMETADDVAAAAVYRIADVEAKSFLASEAIKEAERVARMEEENEAMLQLATDIYCQCARGGIVLMA